MKTNTVRKDVPEKRECPRVEVQLQVDLRTKYIYTTTSVLNVSKNGIFIRTPNPLPEGSEVDIVMHFTKEIDPSHFKGVVRWRQQKPHGAMPPGMGLQLISPDRRGMAALADEVKHAPKNF